MASIHPKLIEIAAEQTPRAMIAMLVVSIAYIALFITFIPFTVLAIWFLCQVLLAVARLKNAQWFKQSLLINHSKGLQQNEWLFILLNLYQAGTWAVSSVLLMIYAPQPFELVSFVVAIGIITAATLSMSSLYRAYLVFFFAMIMPQIAIMLYYGEHQHIAMVTFSIIYIPATILLSKSILSSRLSSIHAHEELHASAQAFKKLSITDSLTNLYNRRYFFEMAKNILLISQRENQPVSMLILDIDHFKSTNDIYGHQGGDAVLINLAKNLQPMIRKSDILARVGGEEFAIILNNIPLDGAKILAEKIRDKVATSSVNYNSLAINITVSIGVATLAPHQSSIEQLFMAADKQLYLAKESGRNRCCP